MIHNEQFRKKPNDGMRQTRFQWNFNSQTKKKKNRCVCINNEMNFMVCFICAYCEPWRGDNIILWAQCCSCNIRCIVMYMYNHILFCSFCHSVLFSLSLSCIRWFFFFVFFFYFVQLLYFVESKLFELLWYVHHVFLLYSTDFFEEMCDTKKKKNKKWNKKKLILVLGDHFFSI